MFTFYDLIFSLSPVFGEPNQMTLKTCDTTAQSFMYRVQIELNNFSSNGNAKINESIFTSVHLLHYTFGRKQRVQLQNKARRLSFKTDGKTKQVKCTWNWRANRNVNNGMAKVDCDFCLISGVFSSQFV